MKIVFMGTPDFAVGALRALVEAGHEVVAVVTQTDKAKGRSKELLPPPALRAGRGRTSDCLTGKTGNQKTKC